MEIASADVNNKKFSVISNFRPEDQKPEILLNGIVDSTRLPVFFPFRKDVQGNYLADGAALSNIPVHLALDHGCDVIIVLKFRCAGEGSVDEKYDKWIPGLQRFIDMLVDERARVMMRDYEFVNNDLEQENKIKRIIEILERGPGHTPEETEAITLLKDVKLSASGKKRIKLIIVNSEEIPEFHFSNFSKETTLKSMNIGYRAFAGVKNQIMQALR